VTFRRNNYSFHPLMSTSMTGDFHLDDLGSFRFTAQGNAAYNSASISLVPRGLSRTTPKVADCKLLDLFLVIIRPHAPISIVSQLSPARRFRTRARIIFAPSARRLISEFHPRFEIIPPNPHTATTFRCPGRGVSYVRSCSSSVVRPTKSSSLIWGAWSSCKPKS
jgi:hypothetical protein